MDEIRNLLSQVHENLTSQINAVLAKIEKLETSMASIQTNQVRLNTEICNMKGVIIT